MIIKRFGLCFDLNDQVVLFGDMLSGKQGTLQLNVSLCEPAKNPTVCTANGRSRLKNTNYLSVMVGSFEPTIQNDNKKEPFKWVLNLDNIFLVSTQLEIWATLFLKKLTAITDIGIFIENKVEQSKAALYSATKSFNSHIDLGAPKDLTKPNGDYYVISEKSSLLFSVTFEASRINESFTRSYDKILDLVGNIGGAIDFILLFFVVLFHWYENYVSSLRMKRVVGHHLGVPDKMKLQGYSIFNMCMKKNCKEKVAALEEMADEAASFEKLCESMVFNAVMQKYLLPKEATDVAPTIHMMEKMLEVKEKEQGGDQSKLNRSIGYQESGSGKEDDASEGEKAMQREIKTMADVLQRIESIPTNTQQSWTIRENYLKVFNRFKEEFSDATPEHFFEEGDGLLSYWANDRKESEMEIKRWG
jgi:hypothetical protein